MSRGWVASLLRARQVQEDVARERLAQARRSAEQARRTVIIEDQRVTELVSEVSEQSAAAFVAAASARQAAAATWASARRDHAVAEDQVAVRSSAAVSASRQRRSVEKLAERDAAEEFTRVTTARQNELDDIAGRARQRSVGA